MSISRLAPNGRNERLATSKPDPDYTLPASNKPQRHVAPPPSHAAWPAIAGMTFAPIFLAARDKALAGRDRCSLDMGNFVGQTSK
jgi:hypothetical protein